ncbi:MAG: TMEM175 family protein [Thermoanaerobaculia bacterium]
MALSEKLKLEVGHTQLRRLETLTDCVYALSLILIVQWLPLPSESSMVGGKIQLVDLFAEYAGNLVSIGIALAFVIIYWLRSNSRTALLGRTDTVHTSLSIASVFFLLFLLYIVRIGSEVAGVSSRAGESIAVALIGLPLALGWWHAERKGLIREGVSDQEKRDEFVETFTEPVTALITLPFAYLDELYWNLAWLAYIPVSAFLKRRKARDTPESP